MSSDSEPVYRVALRGNGILHNPRFNKGTAFTAEERRELGLVGRLPYDVNTLDQQCQRAYDQMSTIDTPIGKNQFLQSLREQNWVLYYSLITRHLRELIPIIYTPTEVSLRASRCMGVRRVLIPFRPRLLPTTLISFVEAKVSI
jgi:malate dehydrogenase (oxaloacetate-decarboxylating)